MSNERETKKASAARGKTMRLKIIKMERAIQSYGQHAGTCGVCGGSGEIWVTSGAAQRFPSAFSITCAVCKGAGVADCSIGNCPDYLGSALCRG